MVNLPCLVRSLRMHRGLGSSFYAFISLKFFSLTMLTVKKYCGISIKSSKYRLKNDKMVKNHDKMAIKKLKG